MLGLNRINGAIVAVSARPLWAVLHLSAQVPHAAVVRFARADDARVNTLRARWSLGFVEAEGTGTWAGHRIGVHVVALVSQRGQALALMRAIERGEAPESY